MIILEYREELQVESRNAEVSVSLAGQCRSRFDSMWIVLYPRVAGDHYR